MAVQYRIEYDDDAAVATRIDIADSSYGGAVVPLLAAAEPLAIKLPEGKDIFTPVQGSGGTIKVLAKDSDDLRSLYTSDPQSKVVTVYKGGTTASHVVYNGFVNTNFYSEPFDEYDNYEIEIGFNDGLSVLSKYDYMNGGTVAYSGEASAWTAILEAISFLDITYKDIRVVSDMYYNGYTISNDNILENIDVQYDNYYDEDEKPMTARKVIEGILEPLGLIMFTQGGSLWIIDPLKLEEASFTVYIYNASTGVFSSTTSISPNKGIGVTVENYKTGKRLDFKDAYSKIFIDYSGYAPVGLTPNANWQDKSKHTLDGSWSAGTAGTGDSYEVNTTWSGIEGWSGSAGTGVWRGTRLNSSSPEEFHMYWIVGDTLAWRFKTVQAGRISGVDDQFMSIRGQVNLTTEAGMYSVDEADKDERAYGLYQRFRIQCGSHYWVWNEATSSGGWQLTAGDSTLKIRIGDRCENRWSDFKLDIPLEAGVSGDMEVTWYDYTQKLNEKQQTTATGVFFSVCWRDVDLTIVDGAGEDIDYDQQYEAELDTTWQEEAPSIELIHGDSTEGVASHRGAFLVGDEFATGFRYGDMTSFEELHKILFKKYGSQYQESRMILSGHLTCPDIYTDGLAKTGNISDSVNLAGRKFVLLKGTYLDRSRSIDGTWIEIYTDDIEIL